MKKLATFAACTFILTFSAGAHADGLLDFNLVAPTSGSITHSGGNATLVGSGIQVDNVVGLDTPINNNVVRNLYLAPGVAGGQFGFATNPLVSFTPGTSTQGSRWVFGGGTGSGIQIVGAVDLNNDGDYTDPGDISNPETVLLTGQFYGDVVVTSTVGTNTMRILGAGHLSIVNSTLLSFYGMPLGIYYDGGINIQFRANEGANHSLTSTTLLSGDISVSPTPEPTSFLLLGLGGLGLMGYVGRRRLRSLVPSTA